MAILTYKNFYNHHERLWLDDAADEVRTEIDNKGMTYICYKTTEYASLPDGGGWQVFYPLELND